MTIFKKILDDKGVLVYSNKGKSMLPLIKEGRDILVIKKETENIRKWDIVLVQRPSGRYLLHRIVKIHSDGTYTLCGDNNIINDLGIKKTDIIGKLVAIITDGKENNLTSFSYRLYVLFWCKPIYIRKICLKIWNTLNTKIYHH